MFQSKQQSQQYLPSPLEAQSSPSPLTLKMKESPSLSSVESISDESVSTVSTAGTPGVASGNGPHYDNEDSEEQVTLLLHQTPLNTKIHKQGRFKLPPISNMLQNIDNFQTSKQLQDSQLLLELCAVQPHLPVPVPEHNHHYPQPQEALSHPLHHTPHHPASTPPSIASTEYSQDSHVVVQPHPRSQSLLSQSGLSDDNETRSPSPVRSPSSTGLESVATTRQNSNVSFNYERDSSEESMDPNSADNGNNKKRTNLPRETIKILNEWILRNIDNPYPNHSQKRLLLERTGLSNVQLSNWFINKRRRRIFSNLSGNNGQPIKKKRLIDRI